MTPNAAQPGPPRPPGAPALSAFERFGGQAAIAGAIADFYGRVLSDPGLAPFFDGADMETLAVMQTEFFTVALGGPGGFAGVSLADAHRHRGITSANLTAFTAHLVDTLHQLGMHADDVDFVVARVGLVAPDILGLPDEAG